MSFENLGLRAELIKAVIEKGYAEPTPIQAQAIPTILEGRDLMGGAQTGTGKTAAFTLPILQLLTEQASHHARNGKQSWPRALIITPTRELAAQIGESVTSYGKGSNISSTVVFGGVGMYPQISRLRKGVDILVATPGRLLDHANNRNVNLSKIEILVLDEADRMLDMGFIHDIRRILKLLPKRRQNLLFSATYTKEIKKLADGILYEPVLVEVARRSSAAENVKQIVHPVAQADKRALLVHLIRKGKWKQVLVFSRTKHGANKLAKQLLTDNISATAIHGNKSQGSRTKALADFKAGKVCVLVATDVASRGLDINLLPHVVNFDLPHVPEDYVHRIGRTGRAGEDGAAHSLVSHDERSQLRDIERLLKHSIPVENIGGFEMNRSDVAKKQGQRSRSGGSSRGDASSRGENSRNFKRSGKPPRNPYNKRGPKGAKRRAKAANI